MKNLSKFCAIPAIAFAVACNNAPTETLETAPAEEVSTPEDVSATYTVITEGDEIKWEGFKTYSDGKHHGTIQVTEGQLSTKGKNIVGGSFIIDMNSINNLDQEGEYKQKLEGHLRSADFFDVENYPTATFTISGVTVAENGENGATHSISGNLKMRGNEKNITFPAKVNVTEDMIELSTPQFTIDRTEWEVMYGSKNLGSLAQDKLIDNNIKLVVDLKAEKV